MATERHSLGDTTGSGISAHHTHRNRTGARKQGLLRTAVTLTATGLALAVPLSSQAWADLNTTVLQSLQLDRATLKQVKAYDRYRTRVAEQRRSAKKALRFARKQIGKPYRWGAEGPGGYDCSGLAMAAWRKAGVEIPRVTHAQYRQVKRKVKLKELKPGDLVFFRNRNHVGLYVEGGRYLHAPRTGETVRIDKLGKRRKRQFAGAVRPGAPEHRTWSPSVMELVEKIDRMSAEKRADKKPPDKERTPQTPPSTDTMPRNDDSPKKSPRHTPAKKAAPPGGPASSKPARPPAKTRPEPRPRSATPDSPDFRPWAMYTGSTFEFLSAPGHQAI
jgi:cell wall-associated NlpC family hydrolase